MTRTRDPGTPRAGARVLSCRGRVPTLGGWIAAGCVALFGGCTKPPPPAPPPAPAASPFKLGPVAPAAPTATAAATSVDCSTFVDVHAERGLEHVYDNGERGASLMVEAIGGGAGWLDYDRDNRPDLYLTQGGDPAGDRGSRPLDALYRGRGAAGFVPVTGPALVREQGYSQGVAVGDFDDDGFDDIYVTNVDANTLLLNRGDGTFADVTVAAGVGDERWSSSAAWADLDGDGDLDLYVCNYLRYDPRDPLDCRNAKGEPRICHPRDVEHWPDECYLNQGDGTFRAAAAELGLFGPGNKALGVAVADFTNDRLPDIYVANDTTPNFLFVNQGNGRFAESAMVLGCAVDRNGNNQASMGLAVGDYDANGWLDIYSTHFYDESNTLYRNLGTAGFEDVTGLVGLHEPTLPRLAFGTAMADFNQDGLPELLIANGHIENYPGNPLLRMKPQLFAFDGVRWQDCSGSAGPFFDQKQVGRAVALADYDADGDLDAVMAHQNTAAALLENRSRRGHWLAIEFVGQTSNRRGVGCRVVVTAGDRTLLQELVGGSSYASSHQPLLIFGLGDHADPCTVEVLWPSGRQQRLDGIVVDQKLVVREPGPPTPTPAALSASSSSRSAAASASIPDSP